MLLFSALKNQIKSSVKKEPDSTIVFAA